MNEVVPQVSNPKSTPNSTAAFPGHESLAAYQLLQNGLHENFQRQRTLQGPLVEKPEPTRGLDDAQVGIRSLRC